MATEKNSDMKSSSAKAESLLDELIEELGIESKSGAPAPSDKKAESPPKSEATAADAPPSSKPNGSSESKPAADGASTEDANLSFVSGVLAENERRQPERDPFADDLVDDMGFQPKRGKGLLWGVIAIAIVALAGVTGYFYRKDPDLFRAFFTGRLNEYRNAEAQRKREQMIADHMRKRTKYGNLQIIFAPEDAKVAVCKDGLQLKPPAISQKKLDALKKAWDTKEAEIRKREEEMLAKKKTTQEDIDKMRAKRVFRAYIRSPHILKNLVVEEWKGEERIIHKYSARIEKEGYEPAQVEILRRAWQDKGGVLEHYVNVNLKMTEAEKKRREELKEKEEKELKKKKKSKHKHKKKK